jgi:hypothetical protein
LQNEAATSYFFLRQVGASLGVSAAAVLIDQRMTVHSSRLLDTTNRLDPIVQRVLRDLASLIAARANGTSVPDPGNYELFQGLVVTQARLLAFIDICFCLAVAAAIGLMVLALARWRQLHAVEHPHLTSIVGPSWGWEIAINPPAIRGWNNLSSRRPGICLQILRILRRLQHQISRRQNHRWK